MDRCPARNRSMTKFALPTTYAPMESTLVSEIPSGDNWQYEPKWDGFRALVFKSGKHVDLPSKSGQALGRYFPEIVEAVARLKADRFVLDGEIVIPSDEGLSFDALLQRIHPAESRIRKLAKETPAVLVVFDLLVARGARLVDLPLSERRKRLEKFFWDYVAATPASPSARRAKKA